MQFRGAIVRCASLAALAGLAMLPFTMSACGPAKKPGDTRLPVYKVEGEIFINGKPAPGVRVRLDADPPLQQPAESRGKVSPQGVSDESGKVKFTTYAEGDGAPAAKYNISLKANARQVGFGKGDEESVDKLEGAYTDSAANAKNDAGKFTFEVKAVEGKDAPAQQIPKIDLQVDGYVFDEPIPKSDIKVDPAPAEQK